MNKLKDDRETLHTYRGIGDIAASINDFAFQWNIKFWMFFYAISDFFFDESFRFARELFSQK